jgi:hypothetical protein
MDHFLLGFQPEGDLSLEALDRKLRDQFTFSTGCTVYKTWFGPSKVFCAVLGPPPLSELGTLAQRADATMTGAARLVFDTTGHQGVRLPAMEDILRPDAGVELPLPDDAKFKFIEPAEKLVCPVCGGMGKHYSPPH